MKQPLFDVVANRILSFIEKGIYKPGDKLPSVRKVHSDLHVSVGTALRAYSILIDQGIVSGKQKSGFFVARKPGSLTDAPSSSDGKAVERNVNIDGVIKKVVQKESAKSTISFLDAVPTVSMLPFASLRRAVQIASRDLSGKYLSYGNTVGDVSLRESIARRSFSNKMEFKAEDIIITNGALEAINLCLQALASPGDSVVVQTPCYHGILQCIEHLKLKVIEVPSNPATGIDIKQLDNVCKRFSVAACILVPNFNNPNGISMPEVTKKSLASFASKLKIPIIEDDIYGDLFFGTVRPSTIKSYDHDGWILLVSSFSKTLAPGFRVGWCVAGRYTPKLARLKATMNVATGTLVQQAIASLLSTNAYDRHLRKMRMILSRQVALMSSAILKYFPPGTKISQPQGGFVLWVELPEKINTLDLQKVALENGINYMPGAVFSNSGHYKNFIRISCNNQWSPRIENAVRKLGQLFVKS